ncbi:MAG: hypothetical protein A2Y38_23860 [Spirochaetes bacterium GWB1_59_5]|nr:MAG: hypothetical protein A2Y38_23860 [Spirochaetes bacterium GWB1_59_5]
MCARTSVNGKIYRPGDVIVVKSRRMAGAGEWTGFARSETVEAVWGPRWIPLDIPADRFAERNKITGKLVWADANGVISGIGNRESGEVKILTREATYQERMLFGHHRVPVIHEERYVYTS